MKFLVLILSLFTFQAFSQNISGAWKSQSPEKTTLIIATENYISVTEFSPNNFIKTWGGKYEVRKNGPIYIDIDFNSAEEGMVTTQQSYNLKIKKKGLELNNLSFERINPKVENALTGLWVITGRANPEGVISSITPGARRTYKIMADGYFQWLAINTKTGEFSGTGGGKYMLENGIYTENIEFFSRDNSRVGATLSFDAQVSATEWIHSGKSSKGDPIKEIWTKVK